VWNEDEDVPRYKGLYAAAVMRHVAIITVATCSRSLDAATQYSDTRGGQLYVLRARGERNVCRRGAANEWTNW